MFDIVLNLDSINTTSVLILAIVILIGKLLDHKIASDAEKNRYRDNKKKKNRKTRITAK